MKSEIAPHIWLPEAKLVFHPDRAGDLEIHPIKGLLRYGPHSSGLVPDPIRVATIVPHGDQRHLYEFMRELHAPARATERRDYLQDWPGFTQVFKVHMSAAGKGCHVELPKELDREIDGSPTPYVVLAEQIVRAVQALDARRFDFDVLFIYLPRRWEAAFHGQEDDDFDLHDHLKAITAARGLPIQLVREDKALAYSDRASVMWRIGLALYAKAGGVPWKLAEADTESAFIGISYAVRPVESDRPRFVTCCSQVFDADGAGFEFIAYDAHEVDVQRDNPFMSRTEMFRVMTRSIDLYRRRHAGRVPRKVVVHKSTEFKKDEIDGCMEALHLCEAVDLVQVVEDVGWRGIRIDGNPSDAKGEAANYPIARGSLVHLGPRSALLWMHGSVDGVGRRSDYFQGGRSTPVPLKLVRHAGHGPWDDTARAALALSKMNWNNDALYDHLPVTMSYAKVLARVVKRMDHLGTTPYQFRFFM
ncbi:UNVERIFIED_ORG: hypothetical protein GGE55_001665 [Rhizobium esperanzae]